MDEYIKKDTKQRSEDVNTDGLKSEQLAHDIAEKAKFVLSQDIGTIVGNQTKPLDNKDREIIDLLHHNQAVLAETSKLMISMSTSIAELKKQNRELMVKDLPVGTRAIHALTVHKNEFLTRLHQHKSIIK